MLSKINVFGRVNERDGYVVLRKYEKRLICVSVERDNAYRHITFEDEDKNRLVWVTTNKIDKESLFNKTRKYAFGVKELRGGPSTLESPRIVIERVREVAESGTLDGYEVGTRINIGVLCTKNTLTGTRQAHAEITFTDANGTTFVWRTTKKQSALYAEGETYTLGMSLDRLDGDRLYVKHVRKR